MRFPEDKIKEKILHPDLEIRTRAIGYFARSYSSDPGIMPLVIQSVETHGREDAYRVISLSRDLRQSAETVTWVIDELNNPRTEQYEAYADNLSRVLLHANPDLLIPRESAILEARHFLPDLQEPLTERLRMLSWDAATCWQQLEEYCEESTGAEFWEIDWGHAERIVEALARVRPDCAEKIHAILSRTVTDYKHDPLAWMQPLIVRLAGQMRLESAIALIVANLHVDSEVLDEECIEALTRIGTPGVIEAIAAAFPEAEDYFRIFATTPLEQIPSDLAVEKCVHLVTLEKDDHVLMRLASALLHQFAPEGIAITRQLLLGKELDFMSRGLRNELLTTCRFTGERFPEYDEWLATREAEQAEHQRVMTTFQDDPARTLLYALENLTGKKPTAVPTPPSPEPEPLLPLTLPREPVVKQRVGRNEPCPCGSKKKFKNCCMRKQ